jgi:hypothetical protein
MMKITVRRTTTLDNDVAAKVGEQFMEWLDQNGFCLVPKAFAAKHSYSGDTENEALAYADLAEQWVAEWGVDR